MSNADYPHAILKKQLVAASRHLLVAAALVFGANTFAADENVGTDGKKPLKQCIECHEAYFAIADSKHFVAGDARTPKGSGKECESCHGDTTEHNRRPRVKGLVPVTFGKKFAPESQNAQCLNCHQSGPRIHWQGSAHDRTKMACASCHKAHAAKDPMLVPETQPAVCFECHKDRRSEMLKASTHATKSGFFGCSNCHQPHGSPTRASLQKNSVNETCHTCHADKRGPFLWEHRSAQNDCTNCHNPHGTNVAPMLKVKQPYLCQQCHSTAIGHSAVPYAGDKLTTGSPTNQNRMIGRSCTNCHMKVHGSNHPSGARLQR